MDERSTDGHMTSDEAQERDPQHARSEQAAETPTHDDAERMEAALREGGPLGPADPYEEQRRDAPTAPGGTSLT